MGVNLAKHKRLAFCISSFFAGVGGALFAMFANNAQAKVYTSTMTYEILLIVVIGGIGSISAPVWPPSCMWPAPSGGCASWITPRPLSSPLRPAASCYHPLCRGCGGHLRHADPPPPQVGGCLLKELIVWVVGLLLMVWWVWFIISGSLTIPFARNGFRMVVFSVIIMIVVLFFRRGMMGDKEFTDLLFRRKKQQRRRRNEQRKYPPPGACHHCSSAAWWR